MFTGPHHRERRAFTLIELLVVVSIIAVLAAILLPTLGKAKARAHVAACANNLRQMHTGLMDYAEDWDSWMMRARWTSMAAITLDAGDDPTPYFSTRDITRCPSHEFLGTLPLYNVGSFSSNGLLVSYRILTRGTRPEDGGAAWYGNYAASSYLPTTTARYNYRAATPNLKFLNSVQDSPDPAGIDNVRLFAAEEQALAMDGMSSTTDRYYTYSGTHLNRNNHNSLNGINVVFVDGHLKWSGQFSSPARYYSYGGSWQYFDF